MTNRLDAEDVVVSLVFQSPYGDFGNVTAGKTSVVDTSDATFQSPYGDLGTLTGMLSYVTNHFRVSFQSPYGDLGTLTLSLSTRSLTGLTGEFFKPPAFFVFSGDPGEK